MSRCGCVPGYWANFTRQRPTDSPDDAATPYLVGSVHNCRLRIITCRIDADGCDGQRALDGSCQHKQAPAPILYYSTPNKHIPPSILTPLYAYLAHKF